MKGNILCESRLNGTGCLMLNFKSLITNWNEIINIVNPNDIYDDEEGGYGLEQNPHISILCGINPSVNVSDIKNFINNNVTNVIGCTLTQIDLFESDDYDVLKFNIESEELHKLNSLMADKFPFETSFPDYNPHMTIAYVKSGIGKNYVKKIKPLIIKSKTFEYSVGGTNNVLWKVK